MQLFSVCFFQPSRHTDQQFALNHQDHAIFTHSWNAAHSTLFVAGGPIVSNRSRAFNLNCLFRFEKQRVQCWVVRLLACCAPKTVHLVVVVDHNRPDRIPFDHLHAKKRMKKKPKPEQTKRLTALYSVVGTISTLIYTCAQRCQQNNKPQSLP